MNPLELVNLVNQFYDQAFNKLLVVTFGLIGFIGIIVPLAVGWLQLRTLRAEKSSLLSELRGELNAEREQIEAKVLLQAQEKISEIKAELESKIAKAHEKIKVSSASATARAHHLQAGNNINDNDEDFGLNDLCFAASLYFTAKEEDNVRRCLTNIIENCLPKMTAANFTNNRARDSLDLLLKKMTSNNENRRYGDDIRLLEQARDDASKRNA